MKIINDVLYDNQNKLDIYIPESSLSNRTIIYFHGGGIESGDKGGTNINDFAKSFTNEGICFVSANYSMYPTAKFPEYIEDCAKSIKFIFENINKYGLGENIFISGSSAGAYLAMMLCTDKKYLSNEGVDISKIAGWISDDGQMTDHFNIMKYEIGVDPWIQRITERSPIYFIDQNTKINNLLIIYYDKDMPMRKEQNLLFVSTLKHFDNSSNVTLKELVGTHCEGTSVKDADGEYRFVKIILEWLKSVK